MMVDGGMRMRENKLVMVAIIVVFVSSCVSAGQFALEYCGSEVAATAPQGYYEIISVHPESRNIFEVFTPPKNRLLAACVSEEDMGRILSDQEPLLNRYMMVQMYKETSCIPYALSDFRQYSDYLKNHHSDMIDEFKSSVDQEFDNVSELLSDGAESSVLIGVDKQVPLGVFIDKADAVGVAQLTRMTVEQEQNVGMVVTAGGFSMVLAAGEILYVYVYSRFQSQEDIDWVRDTSAVLVNSLVSSH